MAILNPGGRYWISASAPGGFDQATLVWYLRPSPGVPGLIAVRRDSGPWMEFMDINLPVFRITGVAVPEPAAWVLVTIAGSAWAFRR